MYYMYYYGCVHALAMSCYLCFISSLPPLSPSNEQQSDTIALKSTICFFASYPVFCFLSPEIKVNKLQKKQETVARNIIVIKTVAKGKKSKREKARIRKQRAHRIGLTACFSNTIYISGCECIKKQNYIKINIF